MKTLFIKDVNDLSRVIEGKIDNDCLWVYDEGVRATIKRDGTSCAIIDGKLYKRYDNKKEKSLPPGAIECQSADVFSGHHPYWILCDKNDNSNKYHFEAFYLELLHGTVDGTYELCGPKINGNPEGLSSHYLLRHGSTFFPEIDEVLKNPKEFLRDKNVEGIVFHHPDGRMCKIRKKDFGMSR
jgi:hypothetical protein